ncbi:hypothetical protein [Roseibium sediminicola]|uniref:Uncharacterized protein n=1 Tax=Roseibium sediminicola TaxID=2933272 RepID=A0ABT0GUQ6_9HYPH|nr:hypothetical protein [Roseibium sp. CAU 1639]MCK7613161.1 hypothetical protein [Roseibium sp. CAU 1639]
MTSFAVLIPLVILVGVGFYVLDRSKERHNKSHHRWQPDVNAIKAETINLETPSDH